MSSPAVSGLAASIRSSVESETFDLAGSNASTIETTIHGAFAEPFTLTEMIRLTFVTGAGKLGRARYDDGAARAITSTLLRLGYNEDRGASAVLECAGSFKLQHDTGKNLKTVVVFPLVTVADDIEGAMGGLGLDGENNKPFLVEGSIEEKIAMTTMNVFPRMLESKCETWSQKKVCIVALTELKERAASLDTKLMHGQPLSDSEQDFYNSVSLTSLEEKLTCVKELMHKQVDAGNITTDERHQLLLQVTERMESLDEDITDAKTQGKPKRVENLKAAKQKVQARKTKLQGTGTKPPPQLKNDNAIAKLRKELAPMLEFEEAAKGRLLTLKESQSIATKDELQEEIEELEMASRGWFESDEAFETRVKASRTAWQQQNKKKQAAKKKAGAGAKKTSALPATTKWVTPGAGKQVYSSKPAKKSLPKSGGLFAAMMNDSDSD